MGRSGPEEREGINVYCPVGIRGFFVYNWQQISTVNTPLYTLYWFRVYKTRLGILSFFKLNYTESSLQSTERAASLPSINQECELSQYNISLLRLSYSQSPPF